MNARIPGVRQAAAGAPTYAVGQRVSVRPSIYAKSSDSEMGTVVRMNSPRQVRVQFDSGKSWTIPASQIIGTVEE